MPTSLPWTSGRFEAPAWLSDLGSVSRGALDNIGAVKDALGEQYIEPLKVWEPPKQRVKGDVGPVHTYLRDLLAPIPDQVGHGLDTVGDTIREAAGKAPVRSVRESGYERPAAPPDESSGDRAKRLALRAGEGVLHVGSPFALPYTAVAGELVAHHVESDPLLGPEYKRRLAEIVPEDQQRPTVRSQVAHEVVDSAVRRLLDVRNDPNATDAQKNSADALAAGLIAERVAELGGPQGVRQLGQLGARVLPKAAAVAKDAAAEAGRRVEFATSPQGSVRLPHPDTLDAEQLASRLEYNSGLTTRTPAQAAAIAEQAAQAARRGAAVVQFPDAAKVAPQETVSLGDALSRAQVNKQKRMELIVKRAVEGEQISAAQAQELLDFAKAEIPDRAAEFESTLRSVIDEQAEINAARKELAAADKAARIADRDVLKAGNAEARADQGVLGAEMRADRTTNRIAATEARTDVRRDLTYDARLDRAVASSGAAIDRARKNLDALRQNETPTPGQVGVRTRTVYQLSKEDAERFAKYGYASEKDATLLERSGLNIGKFDAEEAAQLAKTIRESPEVFEAATRTVSHPEALQKAAGYLGSDIAALERELERRGLTRGDQSGFLLGVNLTITRLGREYRELVKSGAPKEALDAAYAKYMSFGARVGGADSESGRTLGVLRVQRGGSILENIRSQNLRSGAKLRIEKSEVAVTKAEAVLAKETKDRDFAIAAVEGARGDAARKAAERFAAQREDAFTKAQADLTAQRVKLDEARVAYDKAIESAAAATERAEAAALKAATKGGVDPEAAKALLEIDPEDAQALASAMRNLHKASTGQQAVAFMLNNLYSNPVSLAVNAISGGLRVTEQLLATPVAGQYAKVIARLTDSPSSFARGESARQIGNLYAAIPDAVRAATRTTLEGMDPATLRATDVTRGRAFRGKKGLFAEWALRFNGAADAPTRHLGLIHERNGIARRTAQQELGKGATEAQVSKRTAELIADPTRTMLREEAIVLNGFTYGGEMSKSTEKLMSWINHEFDLSVPGAGALRDVPVVGGLTNLGPTPALKLVIPAMRVTMQLAKASAELGIPGVGHLNMLRLASKGSEYHRAAAYAGARGTFGTMAFLGGVWLYNEGYLIGDDPTGQGRYDTLRVPGTDTYIELRWGFPYTGGLMYAARALDAFKDDPTDPKQVEEKMLQAALNIGEMYGNLPIMRFANDLGDALRGGSQLEEMLGKLAASRAVYGAAALRELDRLFDNTKRDPRGFFEVFKENIPGLNDSIEPEIDEKGQPKRQFGGSGVERFTPLLTVPAPDRVDKALEAAGYHLTVLGTGDEVNSTSLDHESVTRWKILGGQARYAAITRTVNGLGFDQLTTSKKYEAIKNAADAAVKEAKLRFADELVASGDKTKQAAGIAIGVRETNSLNARAKLIERMLPNIDRDPELRAAVEAELRGTIKGPVYTARFSGVIDGDTVPLDLPIGADPPGAGKSFRFAGVNVPEIDTPEGKAYAAALAEFLVGKTLTFQSEAADNFGRGLIDLKANGVSVNDWLVENGYATRRPLDNADKYTLDTYRQVIPPLKQVEAMPDFADERGNAIGTPAIWERYRAEKKQYDAIADNPDMSAADKAAARATFRITHPVYVQYQNLSAPSRGGPNPVKKRFIDDAVRRGIPLDKFVD
jgi:endonuclease YncB( thermonuclease family)